MKTLTTYITEFVKSGSVKKESELSKIDKKCVAYSGYIISKNLNTLLECAQYAHDNLKDNIKISIAGSWLELDELKDDNCAAVINSNDLTLETYDRKVKKTLNVNDYNFGVWDFNDSKLLDDNLDYDAYNRRFTRGELEEGVCIALVNKTDSKDHIFPENSKKESLELDIYFEQGVWIYIDGVGKAAELSKKLSEEISNYNIEYTMNAADIDNNFSRKFKSIINNLK